MTTARRRDDYEALDGTPRYRIEAIGEFDQVIVAKEIEYGCLLDGIDRSSVKVTWMMTGIRRDAHAPDHRLPIEATKSPKLRSTYLHPADFGVSAERGESRVLQVTAR